MVDRPILFSAPMVLALLGGRKTQTRRLAWREKEDPGGAINDGGGQMDYIAPSVVRSPSPWRKVQPSDRLWVREAVRFPAGSDNREPHKHGPVFYEADQRWFLNYSCAKGKRRPGIHMPRWASRLTLTVTDVRVQRLQEMTEADAQAEGISQYENGRWHYEPNPEPAYARLTGPTARDAFHDLWNSIHGAGAWDANPEVVALSFTVEQRNIDA